MYLDCGSHRDVTVFYWSVKSLTLSTRHIWTSGLQVSLKADVKPDSWVKSAGVTSAFHDEAFPKRINKTDRSNRPEPRVDHHRTDWYFICLILWLYLFGTTSPAVTCRGWILTYFSILWNCILRDKMLKYLLQPQCDATTQSKMVIVRTKSTVVTKGRGNGLTVIGKVTDDM